MNNPILITILFATACLFLNSCVAPEPQVQDDCGYLATFEPPKEGSPAEITFSVVFAEIVNGHKNCGFGFRPTGVTTAEINGVTLAEKPKGVYPVYVAPQGFDPRRDSISIQAEGKSYISVTDSMQTDGKRVSISLRPFQPK